MIPRNVLPTRSRLAFGSALLVVTVLAGAFGGTNSNSVASSGPPKSLRVGAIFLDAQGFYGGVKYGFSTAAAQDHIGLSLIQSNVSDDVSSEANLIQQMTSAGVKAIILSAASSTASVPAVKAAHDAKIPVICYNTCINSQAMSQYVYAYAVGDPTRFGSMLGQAAGRYFLKAHVSHPQIGIINCEFVEVCIERRQGFMSALQKLVPGATIASNQQGTTLDQAVSVAENIMRAHPHLSAFFGESGGATQGSVQAVQSSGASGKVVVFGGDMTTQIAQALISNKILKAEVDVSGRVLGKLAFGLVLDAVEGKKASTQTVAAPIVLYTAPAQGRAWIAAHSNGLP